MRSSYQLTEKDLLEAQTSHAGTLFRLGQFTGAVLIAVGIGGISLGQYAQSPVPIVIGLFLIFRLRLSAKFAFRRDFAGQGKVEVITSESGIQFLSEKGTSTCNWVSLLRYAETKHLFLLYPQSNIFNVIPKRAFTPEDVQAFRHVLQQNPGVKSAAHNKRLSPKVIVFLTVVLLLAILLGVVLIRSRG